MSLLSDFLNNKIDYSCVPKTRNRALTETLEVEAEPPHQSNDNETGILAQQYVENEYETYRTNFLDRNGMDTVSSCAESLLNTDFYDLMNIPNVYKKYRFDCNYRTSELPIDAFKEKIVELVAVNSVVVAHGPTGCGKTTQVPQYILDFCRGKNLPCKIIVTQPRRIAAINIAQRVCQERGWSLGSVCGYQIGLNRQVGEDSILTYVTTEILLQKLILQKNLNCFTHIIIDEVHERSSALDFLLLIVRKYLFTNSPNVKIILMSATIEAEEFSYYFRSQTVNSVTGDETYLKAPILNINKKMAFTINTFYIDQMVNLGKIPEFDINSPEVHAELYQICLKLLGAFNKLDEVDVVTNEQIIGSVLIFLPGIHEIEEIHKLLENECKAGGPQWDIIPIHSSLSKEHQAKAFEKPKPGVRKIIVSTNIAESSITVSDVYYVIDFCLTKVMKVNPKTNFSTLALEWASHNNCKQRAGRVGRVANGRVYRLVPREFYHNLMCPKTTPELQRAPLENVILYMKMLGLNDTPKFVLSLALSPPNLQDVDNAVLHLKEIGALLQYFEGKKDVTNGDISFLGIVMSSLPIDVHLSKLIVLGHAFNCLRETVIMAAGSMIQNLFVTTFQERIQGYRKRLVWADCSCSDFIALLNLYDVWQTSKRQHDFRNLNEEKSWCKKNYINYKGMKDWQLLINEIYSRLQRFNITVNPNSSRIVYNAIQKPTVLKVIISGAFYPNYFIKCGKVGDDEMKEATKILGGRDPFKCVYFTNMKMNHPGYIYTREIKRLLNADKVEIGFDQSSKVYVEYKNVKRPEVVRADGNEYVTTIAGDISIDMYEAIRKRQLNFDFPLKILPDEKAWEFVRRLDEEYANSEEKNCFSHIDYSPFPTLDIEHITIIITATRNAGFFYCQNYNDETVTLLNKMFCILNSPETALAQPEYLEADGKIYMARFDYDKKYYRCKILCLDPEETGVRYCQILFVDYGNTEKVRTSQIFELPENYVCSTVPIAMRCALSEVMPLRTDDNGEASWSPQVNKLFVEKTANVLLHAKVYSVVDDVLHLELYFEDPSRNNKLTSLNKWLIEQNLAEKCEESFLSNLDHKNRLKVLRSENPISEAQKLSSKPTSSKSKAYKDFEYPEVGNDAYIINLRGPFSPLETKVAGLTRATASLKVNIDVNSVNTVLFDNNPDNPHARLLVAGHVMQSSGSGNLKISHTTFMPHIHGFPMMMALLFCPTMEPKLTTDGTRVASILCGLGCKDNKMPCHATHDLLFTLDTELNEKLILKIIEMRYVLNKAVGVMKNISNELQTVDDLSFSQQQAKDTLFQLLGEKQKSVEPMNVQYANVWNKSLSDDVEVLKLNVPVSDEDIWPLLWFVKLKEKTVFNFLKEGNLKELEYIAKGVRPEKDIVCELCGVMMYSMRDVRVHLLNKEHKAKYEAIKNNQR